MTSHRPLLKLEDKLAGETRRLGRIGGPTLSHLLPVIVIAALALHAGLLFVPLMRFEATLPASSPAQDYPFVWRTAVPPPPLRAAVAAGHPAVAPPSRPPSAAAGGIRAPAIEPVPEPPPEIGAAAIVAEVEAVIPPPDAPPPALDPGPPSPAAPAPSGVPVLVEKVQPVYPTAARALRAEARVTIRATVGADGRVEDTSVLGCTRPNLGFESAALDSVRRWRYAPRPAGAGSRAVIVTVDFKRQAERP